MLQVDGRKVVELTESLAASAAQNVQLCETVSSQQAFLSALSTKLELYNRDKAQMRQRLGEYQRDAEDARRENAKLLETLTGEMAHSKGLQGDMDKSTAHVRLLEDSLVEEKRLRMAAEKERDASRAQADALQAQLSELEFEIRQCIHKLGLMSALKAQMAGLSGFLEDLQEQNAMLREELVLERQRARKNGSSPIQRHSPSVIGPILATDPTKKAFFQASPEKAQKTPFPGMESPPKSFATKASSLQQKTSNGPVWSPIKNQKSGSPKKSSSVLKSRNGLTTEPPIWTMRGPSSPTKKEPRQVVAHEQQAMGSQNTQMFSWLEMGNPTEHMDEYQEAPTFLFEEAQKAKHIVAEFTQYIQSLEDS